MTKERAAELITENLTALIRKRQSIKGSAVSSLININGSVYYPQMKSVFYRAYDEKTILRHLLHPQ